MKRINFLKLFVLVPIAIIAFTACNDEPGPDDQNQNNQEQNKPEDDNSENELKPGPFKFVASSLQGKWNPGDKIYVHGNLGSWAQTVTLAKDNISADGKTATAELGEVTERPVAPDLLYAAWPDESVKHGNGKIGPKTSFSSCEGLLTVAYLRGDTFTFTDVSSSMTFSVSGDYDKFALSSNIRDGLTVTNFEVEYTSAGSSFNQKENTGYPFRYGAVRNGKADTVFLPGSLTLRGGVCIYLGKGEQWTGVYRSSEDVVLDPGKNKDLGDISAHVEAYDGPAPKMPELTGNSKVFSVNFQELSGLCMSEDNSFIWTVGDEGDLAKLDFEGKVLSQVHIGGDSEDVSWNRDNGDLIIGLEPDGVGLVKSPYTSRVSTLFNISACKNYGNSGIEGLTYYKNGLIFCGAQANSHFFLCELNEKKVLKSQTMWDKNLLSEIAGMCYDHLTDWLWVIDSEAKKVFVFSAQRAYDELYKEGGNVYNALLGAYPVNGPSNPESVCVDHVHSCIWVGDDYGSTSYLYRYDFSGLDDALL